jgi:GTP-dependent phosphoenolpyruvate carboxykinase
MTLSEFASYAALGGWGVSVVVGVLKARDWVEGVALAAVKSAEGRAAVLEATTDKHSRVEDKLDVLAKRLEEVVSRIDGLSRKVEERMDRLDREVNSMTVRVAVLEKTGE